MKMELLDIVHDIASALDSDEVNSIDDTVESMQIAQLIKTTYFAMMSNRNWPHLRKTIQVTSYSNNDLPTHMTLPSEVKELISINYDVRQLGETRRRFTEMKYLQPDAFLRMSNQLNSDNANVLIVTDPTGVELLIRNDKAPEYYTSFDDTTIVFDSYVTGPFSTLAATNVQAMAYVMPKWEMRDDFIPDLPEEAFSALVEEAKNRAFIQLKQFSDSSAANEASRQQRWLSRKAWRVEGGIKYPNYGRRR